MSISPPPPSVDRFGRLLGCRGVLVGGGGQPPEDLEIRDQGVHLGHPRGDSVERADLGSLLAVAFGDAGCLVAVRRRLAERVARGVLRSEEHTSELQSLMRISYAV